MFINYFNENLQEILYYLATSISINFKQTSMNYDIKIKENTIVNQDLEAAGNKLKEINNILESRVSSILI
jgi:hypothetical protein